MTPLTRCDAEIARIRREPLPCWLAALAELDWEAERREIMSDCGCVVSLGDAEQVEVLTEKWVIARKAHACSECGDTVPPGDKYFRESYDSRIFRAVVPRTTSRR